MNARTRNLVLLAAAIGRSICEEEDTGEASWARVGVSHHRTWAWSPRAGGAWRTAARLSQHGRSRPGQF